MRSQPPRGKPGGGWPSDRPPRDQSSSERIYPVLKRSKEAFVAYQDKPGQNVGLIFDRFLPDLSQIPDKQRGEARKNALSSIIHAAGRVDAKLLAEWSARWELTARAAQAEPTFTLKTDWRFLTGLGRRGPLEVGFTFHRYGFPILPGSSVKGVARAWATVQLEGVDLAERDSDFIAVFGRAPQKREDENVAQSGGAVFFDAIPARIPKLELDIMNPHFPDYYGDKTGKKAPTDWQIPRPVFFLTVAPKTEFRFAVGWRGGFNHEAHRLRDLAKEWLVKGLTDLGAGAKTSAGYGYFLE
jgi:CRISPR-associated protein Cmr6